MAQGDNGQTFTSGGGFSKHFPQPDYQKAAVAQYFALSSSGNTAPPPASGYNAQGRGYPDVAFAGSAFAVYIGGMLYRVSGTSASAPAFGGVLSNINAARMAIGKGSVGWVNPALYMHSASFARDITSGDNLCCANGKCCPQGFYAIPGWDPVSGLGSVYYSSMETLFLSLGKSDRTDSPIVTSAIPTARPTFTPTRATYTYITVSQVSEKRCLVFEIFEKKRTIHFARLLSPALTCFVMPYPVTPYHALPCPTLPYLALPCPLSTSLYVPQKCLQTVK